MHPYLQTVFDALAEKADEERAAQMKAYMRHQFEFLGVPAPIRKKIGSETIKKMGLPESWEQAADIIKESFAVDEREIQYFGMELMEKMHKKWDEDSIFLLEYLITKKSWWDTVDFIAPHLVGTYFQRFPHRIRPITQEWSKTDNKWLQRTCIIFQLNYKSKTDTVLLFEYILVHRNSKEFFIQKAIGWALRQYARTDAVMVKEFVSTHKLAPLSQREALKHIT